MPAPTAPAPPPPPKRAKTETLSLRLDPKTKFMLDFVARVQGQSITTVVERAVRSTASKVGFEDNFGEVRAWDHYWDPSEGYRLLKLWADNEYPSNYDEDEVLQFCKTHWPFFYINSGCEKPHRAFIEILWPSLEEYLSIWRNLKHSNYWSAGEAMQTALSKARVAPPDWPTGSKTAPKESFSADLDDEIPF